MPDMLVKLYTLPPMEPAIERCAAAGITIRRGIAPEKSYVVEWTRKHFGDGWANEVGVAYGLQPVTCFVATTADDTNRLVGFACYDSTCKAFFGPTGVDEAERGKGIGTGLLLACLHAMRWYGYGYAIIGAAGPTAYYEKTVGAVVIPDSWPGVYTGMLREPQ